MNIAKEKSLNILNRILETNGRDLKVDLDLISKKAQEGLPEKITLKELTNYLVRIAAADTSMHPDYSKLAARIALQDYKKEKRTFFDTMKTLKEHNSIREDLFEKILKHRDNLEAAIDLSRDNLFDYFGFKTLEKSYLLKLNGVAYEYPQHLYMRIALSVSNDNIENIKETYDLLSRHYYTHASPTIFNAGTKNQQLASCFVLPMKSDSMEGILDTIKEVGVISKYSGGVGLSVSNIRCNSSRIESSQESARGVNPMLKLFNELTRYTGGGAKRRSGICAYLEPWHFDVEEFIQLRRNVGNNDSKTRDLFLALWVCDLFMVRVKNNEMWSLFDPKDTPDLPILYGEEFEKKYIEYETKQIYKKQIKARELMATIIEAQIETGTPFMLYKDHANKKSNQKNLGTILSSNLCTEIMEVSSADETAVCNLASVVLWKFVEGEGDNKFFNFDALKQVSKKIIKNLNNVIDIGFYPTENAKKSNLKHRPLGLGVQGLADVFFMLDYSFGDEKSRVLNSQIFECLYFAALESSCELAKERGAYESFDGSPASQGILQFDMWGVSDIPNSIIGMDNWNNLKEKIKTYGLRNSLLIAPMPTASTAQIIGSVECFEPVTSNLYNRDTTAGLFVVFNKHLVKDLEDWCIWNQEIRDEIVLNNGSIQNIPGIHKSVKAKYKTAYEIGNKTIIEMAADRAKFIDQSMSLNLFSEKPGFKNMMAAHFHAWKLGLKTGMYYLRSKAAARANKVQVKDNSRAADRISNKTNNAEEDCTVCSS